MTQVFVAASVGGQALPVLEFRTTTGSYGSVGSARITSSISAVADAGIDLYELAGEATSPVPVYVSANSDSTDTTPLFGGEYVSTVWDYDKDLVHVRARSWAGELVDQKRVLTKIAQEAEKVLVPLAPGQVAGANMSNQNQLLGDIVTSICNQFGLTPVLNLDSGNDPVGVKYGTSDQVFMPVPQSLWSILNQLARDTGYAVYDTPQKQLVFGVPGAGLSTINLSYRETPPGQDAVPIRDLSIEHHPRRNATFRVVVFSYQPSSAQVTIGRCDVVSSAVAGQAGLSAGVWSGQDAQTVDSELAKLKSGSGTSAAEIPLYTFHRDGLTPQQAQDMATSLATDISRRELIMSFRMEGYPAVLPTQALCLAGQVNSNLLGENYYVNSIEHSFVMPRRGGSSAMTDMSGFVTSIKALNIPTLAGKGGTGPLL